MFTSHLLLQERRPGRRENEKQKEKKKEEEKKRNPGPNNTVNSPVLYLFFLFLLLPQFLVKIFNKRLTYAKQGLDLGRQPTDMQTGPGIGAEGPKKEELSPSFSQQFASLYAEWDMGWHKAIVAMVREGEKRSWGGGILKVLLTCIEVLWYATPPAEFDQIAVVPEWSI